MISPCVHYRSKGGAGRGVGEIKPGSAVCREFLRRRRLFCLECDALGPPQKARPEAFEVPPVKTIDEILAQAGAESEKSLLEGAKMNIAENNSIGQAIREARQARGLTVKAAAAMVGVSENNFHVWEKGLSKPGYANALKLDAALGLELVREYGAGLKGRPKDSDGVDDDGKNQEESVRASVSESVAGESVSTSVDESGQSCSGSVRDCGPAALEQRAAAIKELGLDGLSADQVVRVLSGIADTLTAVAGGLSQIIKTLREAKR